jgi:ABC-2 type transport system ATP-binding protein
MREAVGIVLQQCGVQQDLSVRELVEMYGRYHDRRRPVDEVIELVELTEKRDVRAKNLSGGQRRRLDLALALVGDPDLIFLDEPTTGFDPAARRQAWSAIRSLCDLGKTIFLTTHFMDEAQALADRVAVMRGGEIIAAGRPDEIGGRNLRPAEIRFALPSTWSLGDIPDVPSVGREIQADRVTVFTREPVIAAHEITTWALHHDVELGHFSVTQPTLEDIYLELTGSGDQHETTDQEVAR